MIVTGINLTDHPTASPADLNNHWCHFLTATSGCCRERGSQNTVRSLANCSRSRTQHVVQMDRYWELPPPPEFQHHGEPGFQVLRAPLRQLLTAHSILLPETV